MGGAELAERQVQHAVDNDRLAAGKVKPQVDATFPLEAAAAAHAHLEGGAHVGKVILTTQ